MSELDEKTIKENKNIETFSKMLRSDLDNFGGSDEKTLNNNQNNEINPDFDLTARDILDLIGDDNIKSLLNFPEKASAQLALKIIPEKDRANFQIGSKNDSKFADMKLRLANKILDKYGSDLNVKVSPEIALAAITVLSVTMVFVQTRTEANRYVSDLQKIEGVSA